MTDLAERTTGLPVVEKTTKDKTTQPSTPSHAPPGRVPRTTPHVTPPWPPRAKFLVAVLLVVAVLGAVGTVLGFTSGGDQTATEQDLQATVDTLTAERADLVAQATDFQATIDTLTTERDGLVAQLGELDATVESRTGQRDSLVAAVDRLETTIATLTAGRDVLVTQVTELEADLAYQTLQMSTTVSERNALANLFPVAADASLDTFDLVGTYDIKLTKAYCEGFASCATLPPVSQITIRQTPEGYLELVMSNYLTAGLFRVDGALYAIADSTTAVPSCSGTPRIARVAVTIYGQGVTVATDGAQQLTDLGASITVQAPAVGTCPAGLAFYGGQITP